MRETIDRMLAAIREYLAKMPRKNKIQMAVLALFVIILAVIVVSLLTQTKWALLPNTGDPTTTSHIYTALREMGIPVDPRGNLLYVPEKQLEDARMQLVNLGLLGTHGFTYDMFAEASGFGVSSEHAKKAYDFQLGDHIATQLKRSSRIQDALVIVHSGESSAFRIQSNIRRPTVSVHLSLIGGGSLSQGEVNAVADVVKGSVPGIAYDDISIVDTDLKSYRAGDANSDFDTLYGQRMQYQNKLIEQTKTNVEQLLAPIYDISNMRILPNIILNFDNIVISQVEFFPPIPGNEDGIVRSMEEVYEMSRRWSDAEGIPGTDSNAMGTTPGYPWGDLDERDEYRRTMRSRNYDINETRTAIDVAQGKIEEFTIGILINSEIEEVDEDYTTQLTDLVSKAIGISPASISIQHMPFSFFDTTWQDMLEARDAEAARARMDRLIEQILMYGTILMLAVMVIMLVRSVLRTFRPPPEPEEVLVAAGAGGMDIIIGDEDSAERTLEDLELTPKSAGLEQIERFIDKDAATVAQLLRNWLSDE